MLLVSLGTKAVMSLLLIVLYVILLGILLIFLILLVDKLIKFNTLRYKPLALQRGELIKKKMFIAKDKYELRWFGDITDKSKYIILFVHDLYGDRKDCSNLESWVRKNNKDYSVVSFDQRNCGENKPDDTYNVGATLSDIEEIIDYLLEKHESKKIILIGEGYGANLVAAVTNDSVERTICLSFRTKFWHLYNSKNRYAIFLGTLFSSRTKLQFADDFSESSNNNEYVKTLNEKHQEKLRTTVREFYQYKYLNKKIIKNVNKLNSKNIELYIPDTDIYSNKKLLGKIISKLDDNKFNLEIIEDSRHYLMNEPKSDKLFTQLFKNDKKNNDY